MTVRVLASTPLESLSRISRWGNQSSAGTLQLPHLNSICVE
jgi:hypothetical protein